jgi:hypothetical protein
MGIYIPPSPLPIRSNFGEVKSPAMVCTMGQKFFIPHGKNELLTFMKLLEKKLMTRL